ncbi:hypothetical protein OUZ56_007899 [Daphnia magna]|uniref:Uncharacterized protein n=1 Tax=Daphnia magna TaxID=35525 RepID=A0ABR0ABJ4_9CRUS|nr:hypothetical protein OUZ56_007899 [Daphnia magna]
MDLVSFPLNDCHGYSVKFSPFVERRIACVASQNYGLSGDGGILWDLKTPEVPKLVGKNIQESMLPGLESNKTTTACSEFLMGQEYKIVS